MKVYEEYAKLKAQIVAAQDKLKTIEKDILMEISDLSEPMRTSWGTFTTVTRKYYKLSPDGKEAQKKLKDLIKEVEAKEIESGKAEVSESTSVRFSANKEEK